jgi:hypothetical protein
MSFKDKYSFWIDRKVDGFVYRFSEFKITRHAVGAPEHWDVFQEFNNSRECAREWRRICDEAIKEQSRNEALETMAEIEQDNGMSARWTPRGTPAKQIVIGGITLTDRRSPGDAEAEVQRNLIEQEAKEKTNASV